MNLTFGVFFDGTGNNRNDDADGMSNIGKLSYLYEDALHIRPLYIRGVGTHSDGIDDPIDNDFGEWEILGAAFGKGGKERIDYILKNIDMFISRDVTRITLDVFGFSRGAALARSFINILKENSHQREKIKNVQKDIRFAGLYDTVGSFSTPGDNDDPYNFHLNTDKARFIYHMVSQDELRKNFDLQSLKTHSKTILAYEEGKPKYMVEESFPGVHSDIGGGYGTVQTQGNDNNFLARIYLKKMHEMAKRAGVPFHPLKELDQVKHANGPISWKIPEDVLKDYQSLKQYYHAHGELIIYHQPLKDTQRRLEVMQYQRRTLEKNKAANGYCLSQKERHIEYAENRIKALRKLMAQKIFNNNFDLTDRFIQAYDSFHSKYIHKSHAPYNTPVVMAAQTKKRNKTTDIEKFIDNEISGFELDKCFKRDIFWNRKKCTQFLEARKSVTCYLQFVSKKNPADTFPAGVDIEVWDKDLIYDDKLGSGVTDEKGNVSILCYDLDEKADLFFTFEGAGKKFMPSGTNLPEKWESWHEKCLRKTGKSNYINGRFPDYDQKTIGKINQPRLVFV